MNKPTSQNAFETPKVTTGPLPGSSRVYSAPEAAPYLS
jgi:phosphomethylpyrimidine synthase